MTRPQKFKMNLKGIRGKDGLRGGLQDGWIGGGGEGRKMRMGKGIKRVAGGWEENR